MGQRRGCEANGRSGLGLTVLSVVSLGDGDDTRLGKVDNSLSERSDEEGVLGLGELLGGEGGGLGIVGNGGSGGGEGLDGESRVVCEVQNESD